MDSKTTAAFLRRPEVEATYGLKRSALYRQMQVGLWPRPVSITPRAVGWPAHEVDALIRARIAGKSEADIRKLVERLHAERAEACA